MAQNRDDSRDGSACSDGLRPPSQTESLHQQSVRYHDAALPARKVLKRCGCFAKSPS